MTPECSWIWNGDGGYPGGSTRCPALSKAARADPTVEPTRQSATGPSEKLPVGIAPANQRREDPILLELAEALGCFQIGVSNASFHATGAGDLSQNP